MSIYGVLFVLFVALKLFGLIAWSWCWVAAPVWGSVAAYIAVQLYRPIPRRNKNTKTLPSEHNL